MMSKKENAASEAMKEKAALSDRHSARSLGVAMKMKKEGVRLADVGAVEGSGEDAADTMSSVQPSVRTNVVGTDGTSRGTDEDRTAEPSEPGEGGSISVEGTTTTAAASSFIADNNGSELVVAELVNDDDGDGMTNDMIDDADIEARIRQRILQEGDEAQIVKIEEDGEGNNNNIRKTRITNAVLSCVFLLIIILIGVIVGNVLPSRLSKGDSSRYSEEGDGESGSGADVPKDRREQLLRIIIPLYEENDVNTTLLLGEGEQGSEEPSPVKSTTAQYKAFQWMVEADEYDNVDGENILSDNSNNNVLLLERYVLAVLYFSTDGAISWTQQLNFLNTTESVCDWNIDQNEVRDQPVLNGDENITRIEEDENEIFLSAITGIRCDENTGQVIEIRLESNNLNGTLPMELSWLHSLEMMNLWINNLVGTIPNEFNGTNLPRLDFIQLARNQLSGTIPASLTTLTSLITFIVFENKFTGTIPLSFFALEELQTFNVFYNTLTGTFPEIESTAALQELFLGSNQFYGTIPFSFSQATALKSLYIDQNYFTGTIHTELGLLQELETLSLYTNMLEGTIPSELGLARDLSNGLWLDENFLVGTLPIELRSLKKLDYLGVTRNMLGGEIPSELFVGMTSLRFLELHNNQFSGTLPSEMSYITNLRRVTLHNNSFTGDLDPLICNETPRIFATADCGTDGTGGLVEVKCTCCAECCDDISGGCPDFNVENVSCEFIRGLLLEDNPYLTCNCSNDMELFLPTIIEDVGTAATKGTTMICQFAPLFQFCNEDLSDCAFGEFGREYDDRGNYIGEWTRHEYISGEHAGDVVIFAQDAFDNYCGVDVNGGTCSSCAAVLCPDFFQTWEVRCDNVEEGLAFLGCSDTSSPDPTRSGRLQVLHPQFQQVVYNPGYCAFLQQMIEADGFPCICSDDGLLLSCQDHNCNFCYNHNAITSNNNETAQALCFTYDEDIYFAEGTPSQVATAKNYRITKLPPEKNATADLNGGYSRFEVVTVLQLFDQTCYVYIDDDECISCMNVQCPDGSQGLVVDCTNLGVVATAMNSTNSTPAASLLLFNNCNLTSPLTYDDVGVLQVIQPNTAECVPRSMDVTTSSSTAGVNITNTTASVDDGTNATTSG